MTTAPGLRVVHGTGDLIETLRQTMTAVQQGEVEGLVICTIGKGVCDMQSAWRDDAEYTWARMVAAVASAQHELVSKGLQGDDDGAA